MAMCIPSCTSMCTGRLPAQVLAAVFIKGCFTPSRQHRDCLQLHVGLVQQPRQSNRGACWWLGDGRAGILKDVADRASVFDVCDKDGQLDNVPWRAARGIEDREQVGSRKLRLLSYRKARCKNRARGTRVRERKRKKERGEGECTCARKRERDGSSVRVPAAAKMRVYHTRCCCVSLCKASLFV